VSLKQENVRPAMFKKKLAGLLLFLEVANSTPVMLQIMVGH